MATTLTIIQINNPSFIYGFIALLVITLVIFFGLTSAILSALAKKLYAQNFLKDLHPLEVIYMKKGSLVPIVHGITNQLIKTSQLEQTTVDNKLKRTKKQVTHANPFEYCVYNAIKEKKTMEYAPIVRSLVKKPLFLQLSNFTETINEQVVKTKSYLFLHILHFGVFSFFFLIGFIRLQTGVSRERPVLFLLILLMATITLYFLSLWQLDVFFTKRSIPQLYDEKFHTIKGSDAASVSASNWGWRYFIYDELVLEKAFLPVIYYFDRRNMKDSASSCGSGCGSSCGGGGGGCGGGCGGCGG